MSKLIEYGASQRFISEATLYPALYLARVLSQSKELYRIVTEKGEGNAEVSGRFRHETVGFSDYPAVGDFVMVDRETMESGNGIIHNVLTRKSVFERTSVSSPNQSQVVAANIDLVFICMSLNKDYNLSRLERYLAVAWDSRATPVVVLTKADLCENLGETLAEISSVAMGVEVLATSSFDKASYSTLESYLKPGVTASFIGSSGVGKSTLVNLLAGKEVLATSGIREDDKGRHTTTRRELLLLPQGGIVIDTPGMRELGVESADLSRAFNDIEELVNMCRFDDCTHSTEPGCAVLEAVENGVIEQRRLTNYQKLKKEGGYDGLSSKEIEMKKLNAMFGGKGEMKQLRDSVKKKNNRR